MSQRLRCNARAFTRACALILSILALGDVVRASTSIVVSNVWSRPANDTAVVYAVLQNRGETPDRLVGAESPAAKSITLHETSTMKMPQTSMAMDNMPMAGAMTSMKSLSSIPIVARGTTVLKPGGYHLMLVLRRGITAGEIIPLRLHFAGAGWVATSARVRASPP